MARHVLFLTHLFVSAAFLSIFGVTDAAASCGYSAYYTQSGPSCFDCSTRTLLHQAGCTPSTPPTDTVFYLSGSAAEGVTSLVNSGGTATFVTDHAGVGSNAVALVGGALGATRACEASAVGAGGVLSFSASAWVYCPISARSSVLEWGAASDPSGGASPAALALQVASPIVPIGVASTLAGSLVSQVTLSYPFGVAVIPSSGAVVVSDVGTSFLRVVTPLGFVTNLAGQGISTGFDGSCGSATSFSHPHGIAVFPNSENIVVADRDNNCIRIVSPAGVVSTLAGNRVAAHADGAGATASFWSPRGVAVVGSSGAVVVADTLNHCIRLIDSLLVVTTLAGGGFGQGTLGGAFADGVGTAASFSGPSGVAVVASSGMIVVADTTNNRIRLVSPLGVVTTLAGSGLATFADGAGTAAGFNQPSGVDVIPASGTVVVADSGNNRVRLVSPLGVVTTLAGAGGAAYADGMGIYSNFNGLTGVAVLSSSGAVAVADNGNNRLRLVTLPAVLPACDSAWHHVALTYSPSASPYTLSAYLDGALVLAQAATITLPSASLSYLRIGFSGDPTVNGGSLFSGSLSDLRIYARALLTSEIEQLAGTAVAVCSGGMYTYGGPGCAPCGLNANFVSAAAGCAPSTGPTDTAFFWSGSQVEGFTAFPFAGPAEPNDWTFVTDHSGAPSGAITLGHSYIQGTSVPLGIPSGGTNLPYSASAWVSCQSGISGSLYVLFWGSAGNMPSSMNGINAGDSIALVVSSISTSPSGLRFFVPACSGAWTHAAVVYDSTTISAFVNGTLAVSHALSSSMPARANNYLRIGPAVDFNLSVSDVRIYARALSADEVAQLATPCSGSTYSYGSGACSPCAAGATFVSAVASCMPSTGPTDTTFYLSGTQTEGYAAFPTLRVAPAFVSDHLGMQSGALDISQNNYLAVPGPSAPSKIASIGSFFSASAWVKCPPVQTPFFVLFWGQATLGGQANSPVYGFRSQFGFSLVASSLAIGASASFVPACNGLRVQIASS